MNKVICLLILIIINLNLMHFIIYLQYFIMFSNFGKFSSL